MADQAEQLRKMFKGTYVCPHCGQEIKEEKSNLDYARESLSRFQDRVFSAEIIQKAEKMAEQYEEAVVDAIEDTLFMCLSVVRNFDMSGYAEGHFNEQALKDDILAAITAKKGEI